MIYSLDAGSVLFLSHSGRLQNEFVSSSFETKSNVQDQNFRV